MNVTIEIQTQHGINETDTVTVERFANTIGGSAEADAVCQAANTAMSRAGLSPDYRLYVAKRADIEMHVSKARHSGRPTIADMEEAQRHGSAS